MSFQPELIDLIYDHLDDRLDRPVYSYSMPSSEKVGLLVRENMPGASISNDTGTRTTGFQLIARSPSYLEARELARDAAVVMRDFAGRHDHYDVRVMYQKNEPYPFPLSAGDMVEFVVNFSCQYGVL